MRFEPLEDFAVDEELEEVFFSTAAKTHFSMGSGKDHEVAKTTSMTEDEEDDDDDDDELSAEVPFFVLLSPASSVSGDANIIFFDIPNRISVSLNFAATSSLSFWLLEVARRFLVWRGDLAVVVVVLVAKVS